MVKAADAPAKSAQTPLDRAPESAPGSPSAHPSAYIQHPFRGVMLLAAAVFLFACMDTTTKYLTASYAVPVVMAVRYLVHGLLMVILLAPSQGRRLVRTRRTGLVMVRAACLVAASLFMGLALQRMPVAEATAMVFMAPLLVVLLAGHLMREKVGVLGWVSAITGFAGVLLIARPGSGLDPLGVSFALCGAGVIAVYQLLSRVLASTESTVAMLFHTALLGSVLFGLTVPWFWHGPPPSGLQMLLFVGMGVFGGLGHFLFTAAHRHAPASMLAPMLYLQLMWAGVLGWLVFGHVSDAISILGMCVVSASGAAVALKSHLSRRALADAAPS